MAYTGICEYKLHDVHRGYGLGLQSVLPLRNRGVLVLPPLSPPSVPGWQVMCSMREACLGVSSFECSSHTRSYLEKMTSVRLVPVESTTIQETMESLGLNFSLDPVVTKALLATKIQNLEEFRFPL